MTRGGGSRMQLGEAVLVSLKMIRVNKLRAFFTILGTVMGVTFLIAVITLITGMDSYMKEDFAGKVYGFNSVMLRRRPSVTMTDDPEMRRTWRRRPRLTFEDARWLEERMETPGILSINSENTGRVDGPGGLTLPATSGRATRGWNSGGSSPSRRRSAASRWW